MIKYMYKSTLAKYLNVLIKVHIIRWRRAVAVKNFDCKSSAVAINSSAAD